jgi:hypothetical protein
MKKTNKATSSSPDVRAAIAALLDPEATVGLQRLYDLSNLTRENADRLGAVWPTIPLDKRRALLKNMIDLAENDIQADFTAVFWLGLADSDATIRANAIDGLWEDESVGLIRPLLDHLANDPSDEVQARAAAALGRFVLLGELGHLSDERAVKITDALFETVGRQSASLEARRRAVESLAYSSDERVRQVIRQAYANPNQKMRASAIFAMGRSADEVWNQTVQQELSNSDPELRYEAARAAGELEDDGAVPALTELLKDQDLEVQHAAIWALGQIGGAPARRALQRVASSPNAELREAAQEALAMLQLSAGKFDPHSLASLSPGSGFGPDEEEDEEEWDEDDEEWDDDDEDWDEDDEEWDDDEDWDEDDDWDDEEEWDEDDEEWDDDEESASEGTEAAE